jgi:hypothetical protein
MEITVTWITITGFKEMKFYDRISEVFCEVKRNARRISLGELESKAKAVIAKYPEFSVEFKGLSLKDM